VHFVLSLQINTAAAASIHTTQQHHYSPRYREALTSLNSTYITTNTISYTIHIATCKVTNPRESRDIIYYSRDFTVYHGYFMPA